MSRNLAWEKSAEKVIQKQGDSDLSSSALHLHHDPTTSAIESVILVH